MKATLLPFPQKESLLKVLVEGEAVLLGEKVRLQYGLRTPIFIDLRSRLFQHPRMFQSLASSFAHVIGRWSGPAQPQQVIGVPDTGIPLATATSLESFNQNQAHPITLSVLRKHPRVYPREIVSHFLGEPDSSCQTNLIDDVIASGRSLKAAVERLREADVQVDRIIVCVDREEGGVEAIADLEVPVYALYSLSEILDLCPQNEQQKARVPPPGSVQA